MNEIFSKSEFLGILQYKLNVKLKPFFVPIRAPELNFNLFVLIIEKVIKWKNFILRHQN